MAKVVLVWNEHPTEVVAGFHARKVAKILREKYGHEVVVEKLQARDSEKIEKQWRESGEYPFDPSQHITKYFADKHGSPVFNFQSDSPSTFKGTFLRSPKNFQVSTTTTLQLKRRAQINLWFLDHDQWVVQMPGKFYEMGSQAPGGPEHSWTHKDIRRELMRRELVQKLPKQGKFLHPAISEKIAAAIHERITSGERPRRA